MLDRAAFVWGVSLVVLIVSGVAVLIVGVFVAGWPTRAAAGVFAAAGFVVVAGGWVIVAVAAVRDEPTVRPSPPVDVVEVVSVAGNGQRPPTEELELEEQAGR